MQHPTCDFSEADLFSLASSFCSIVDIAANAKCLTYQTAKLALAGLLWNNLMNDHVKSTSNPNKWCVSKNANVKYTQDSSCDYNNIK